MENPKGQRVNFGILCSKVKVWPPPSWWPVQKRSVETPSHDEAPLSVPLALGWVHQRRWCPNPSNQRDHRVQRVTNAGDCKSCELFYHGNVLFYKTYIYYICIITTVQVYDIEQQNTLNTLTISEVTYIATQKSTMMERPGNDRPLAPWLAPRSRMQRPQEFG